jgi:hypothetical protein
MKKAVRCFQRAQEKLGVGPSTPESSGYDDLYPDRPKGMHRSTYVELMNELDDARKEWYVEFRAELDACRLVVGGLGILRIPWRPTAAARWPGNDTRL